MILQAIREDFTVCKLKDLSEVDFSDEYCFLGKTDEELSDNIIVKKNVFEQASALLELNRFQVL